MKKLIALALMLGLMSTGAYALERTGAVSSIDRLERYASFVQEGTVWSVRSNQSEAALYRMTLSQAPHNGYICFGLELTGDEEIGLIVPELVFYYSGQTALNASAAAIAVDGVRYDFAVFSETVKNGSKTVERLSAPLNAQGMDMLRAVVQAGHADVLLMGDAVIELEGAHKESYLNTRDELAGRSLESLEGMLREWEAAGSVGMWDLNGAWWARLHDMEPRMQVGAVGNEALAEDMGLNAPMYMLGRGSWGESVRKLQSLLIENGYLQGKVDGMYGDNTVRAVCAAQRWLGRMETGCADEVLIELLQSGNVYGLTEEAEEQSGDIRTAEGVCELSVDRYWFADAVESKGGDRRSVLDRDDTMIVYDGTIKNLSKSNLDFYWQISAVVRCGEYEYPCVTACERNGGMSLSSTLPPLGQARLLIYAEIPDTVAGMDGWTLEVSAGDSTFVFE